MSNVCQLFGTRPRFGNNVSHSHRRTSRRFNPNIQSKRYYLHSEKRWIKLTLSARAIKTIDHRGIEAVVVELRGRGINV